LWTCQYLRAWGYCILVGVFPHQTLLHQPKARLLSRPLYAPKAAFSSAMRARAFARLCYAKVTDNSIPENVKLFGYGLAATHLGPGEDIVADLELG